MSARIALLRDALDELLGAVQSDDVSPAIMARAKIAWRATAFVAPDHFPCTIGTRSGAVVTLHGIRDDRLIGSWIDRDGLQLNDWCLDGTLFGADDPDEFDLVLPEDAPFGVAVAA